MSCLSTPEQSATQVWYWKSYPIRYQYSGTQGPSILLIHGFGASSDHWRKNLSALGQFGQVYAIDLLGFGLSAKPAPSTEVRYEFETWGQQVLDFCQEVIGEPTFLVANSIGCIVALQAAVMDSTWVNGIAMLDCSLRLLHQRKRRTLPWYRQWSAPILQGILRNRVLGHFFFTRLARPQVIRKILLQAYSRAEAVTDELVELLLRPAQDLGAADVFLAFIQYDSGPLPEDLLPQVQCPVLLIWGANDPWEPIALARPLADFPAVERLVTLDNVGHCPQDEAPELVNPILADWILQKISI
jgi:pimeloyl-ACP methyl ester carboxylesterase